MKQNNTFAENKMKMKSGIAITALVLGLWACNGDSTNPLAKSPTSLIGKWQLREMSMQINDSVFTAYDRYDSLKTFKSLIKLQALVVREEGRTLSGADSNMVYQQVMADQIKQRYMYNQFLTDSTYQGSADNMVKVYTYDPANDRIQFREAKGASLWSRLIFKGDNLISVSSRLNGGGEQITLWERIKE